jgi:hypothetical protein
MFRVSIAVQGHLVIQSCVVVSCLGTEMDLIFRSRVANFVQSTIPSEFARGECVVATFCSATNVLFNYYQFRKVSVNMEIRNCKD